jgi:hypothetical protein
MPSNTTTARADEAEDLVFDSWFDPIEDGLRAKVRGFIETMIEEELTSALSRPRYARHPDGAGGAGVVGHRHGHRTRRLTGTFGPTEIVVPRARLLGPDGTRSEWKSSGLRAYQRRTLAADALIASTYLAGINTRRVRRALATVFAGGVGKDVVSRVWRKVKTDWDAWNSRSLADEPIVRLILDGTVVRVRLDRKATSISLLVVIGVRADGQKLLLAVKSMGGETTEAWRAVLDDLVARGLRRPEFLIMDGAPGLEKALAAVGWRADTTMHGSQTSQPPRPCPGAAARGDLGRLHRHDLRRDRRGHRGASEGLSAQMAAPAPGRCRQPGGSRRQAVRLHASAAKPVEERQDHQRDRAPARGVQTQDQDSNHPALGRHRSDAVLGPARIGSDPNEEDRWLAVPRHADDQSARCARRLTR